MTKCRDCQELIQFLDGDKRPYDLTPRIHYANPIHKAWAKENSPAKKNGPKPKRAPRAVVRDKDSPPEQAIEVLMAKPLKFKAAEAREMVGAVIIEGKAVDEIVRAALKWKGE